MRKAMKNDIEIRKRLESTFGTEEDRYYVYALCDDTDAVFYIGKGTGSRVLAHEEELRMEKNEIATIKDPEERSLRENEFNRKKERIDEIGIGNVKKVIVKYGLTEDEAFMAESALINVLEHMDCGLCNIANGHASNLEKNNRALVKTKARELDEFLDECAPEPLSAKDIDETILKQSIFISFNNLAPMCGNDRDITWDAVRGEWVMDKEKANKMKYLFAMSRSIIKAVFELKPGCVVDVLSTDNSSIPNRPNSKTIHRDKDYELAQRIADIYREGISDNKEKQEVIDLILSDPECLEMGKTTFNAEDIADVEPLLRQWIKRRYFTERVLVNEAVLNDQYANKILKEKNGEDYKSPQGSVRYGTSLL